MAAGSNWKKVLLNKGSKALKTFFGFDISGEEYFSIINSSLSSWLWSFLPSLEDKRHDINIVALANK